MALTNLSTAVYYKQGSLTKKCLYYGAEDSARSYVKLMQGAAAKMLFTVTFSLDYFCVEGWATFSDVTSTEPINSLEYE